MNIPAFLKNFDGLSLTFTLTFLSFYVPHFFLRRGVGDIHKVQKRVLYGKAKSLNGPELIDFVNEIIKENPKILMPAKKGNGILLGISIAFFTLAFCAIFYDGLSKVFFKSLTNDQIVYINGIVCIVFFILLALSVLLLIWEYLYWVDFGRLKSEFPNEISDSIKVICEKGSHINQVSSDDLQKKFDSLRQIKSVIDNIPPNLTKQELFEKLKADSKSRKNLTNRLVRLFGIRNELMPYIDSRFVELIDRQLQPLYFIETGQYTFQEEKLNEFAELTEKIRLLVHSLEEELTQEYQKNIK